MKSTYYTVVRGYELDSLGHLNNAVYLNYAEQVKWEFLNENKLLETVQQHGLFPVIMENNIRYMHEFRLLDKVRIETDWSCTRSILHFTHTFFNDFTGLKSCRITGKLMFADINRMIFDIPDELYDFIQEEKH